MEESYPYVNIIFIILVIIMVICDFIMECEKIIDKFHKSQNYKKY